MTAHDDNGWKMSGSCCLSDTNALPLVIVDNRTKDIRSHFQGMTAKMALAGGTRNSEVKLDFKTEISGRVRYLPEGWGRRRGVVVEAAGRHNSSSCCSHAKTNKENVTTYYKKMRKTKFYPSFFFKVGTGTLVNICIMIG
jgi:hypothetical protein